MNQLKTKINPRDRLMSRPPEPLPTPLDPDSPEARGWPYDPKPMPQRGQADPEEKNPPPKSVGRPA